MKLHVVLYLTVCVTPSDSMTVPPVRCESGTYYDPALGRCDFCNVICDFADIQGTLNECQTYCPDYEATPSVVTTQSSPLPCDAERKTITTLLISLCGVSALLIGLMVFLVVMVLRRVHSKRTPMRRTVQIPASRPLIVNKSQHQMRPDQYQKNNVSGVHGAKQQYITT